MLEHAAPFHPVAGRPIAIALAALVVFNGIDAVLTLLWIDAGIAEEANPLLTDLTVESPVLFVVVKLALVSLGVLLLRRFPERPAANVASLAACAAYAGVLVQHARVLAQIT